MNKLTIAIPVYERFEYFEEALMSAINQTASVNIIVVDNASTHNKFNELVMHLALSNIKYYRNDTNLGMYGNWNKCIENCETDFVIILGDDDILNPDFASTFYNALKKHPDIKCFHTNIERFGDSAEPQIIKCKIPLGYHSGIEMLKYAAVNGLGINTVAMAFSVNVYPSFQFLYPKYAYSQDWIFAYSAFTNSFCYGEIKKLVHYRVHKLGNALKVGIRAYLSSVLVFSSISNQLSKLNAVEYVASEIKEKWILRNAIISGNGYLVKEMMAENDNPFGVHLKKLLAKDRISSIGLEASGAKKVIIITFMRVLRKLN